MLKQFTSAARSKPAYRLPCRFYSTEQPLKASIKLVGELRRLTEISISKAKEALVATNNDLDAALQWAQKDLAVSGAKKAAKVEGRETKEGFVGVSLLSRGYGQETGNVRAAMVELNCETDFVGRNEHFMKLVTDIAHSTAFHSEVPVDFRANSSLLRSFPVDMLLEAPYLQKDPSLSNSPAASIGSAIRDTISKMGENISLRRAASVVLPGAPLSHHAGVRVASYIHGSTTDHSLGRIGTLALVYLKSPKLQELFISDAFRSDLEKLERALARQIAGFDTQSIRQTSSNAETALYEQPFMMFPGEFSGMPVKSVLQLWAEQKGLVENPSSTEYQGIAVNEFIKWSVGQDSPLEGSSSVSALKEEIYRPDPQIS